MSQPFAPLLHEFQQESAVTRRVLHKVPADKLAWRPHPTSMSLGQLALHLASVPGALAQILQADEFEPKPDAFVPPMPKSIDEIHAAFEQSTKAGEEFLSTLTEDKAQSNWSLTVGGKPVMTQPRIGAVRSIMMNHCYHHRGQLSVYLRMLDVRVPSIYGPSADESPFR